MEESIPEDGMFLCKLMLSDGNLPAAGKVRSNLIPWAGQWA